MKLNRPIWIDNPRKNHIPLAVLLLIVCGCIFSMCDKVLPSPVNAAKVELQSDLNQNIAFTKKFISKSTGTASALPPCDSIMYVPVEWGSELRILNRTISHGTRKGFGPYWQAKGFAWQVIGPTKYQQDSTRERVVFASSDTISYTDTFYICRKLIK